MQIAAFVIPAKRERYVESSPTISKRRYPVPMVKESALLLLSLFPVITLAQGPPPAPPPPPRFMTMKGLSLACFDKPQFEEDGLEFFVCNGVTGISGVRKKADPKAAILIRDSEVALNLNMQDAKLACRGGKRFAVHADSRGDYSFTCDGEENRGRERFQLGSKAEWKKFDTYLK